MTCILFRAEEPKSSYGPGLWLNQGGKVREPFSEVQINTKERSLSISQGNKWSTVLGDYGDFLELKYKIHIFPKFLRWVTKQSLGRFQWLLSTAVSRPSQQPLPSARGKGTEPAGDSEAGYLLPEVSRKQSLSGHRSKEASKMIRAGEEWIMIITKSCNLGDGAH